MNQFSTGEQDPRADANENVPKFLYFDDTIKVPTQVANAT